MSNTDQQFFSCDQLPPSEILPLTAVQVEMLELSLMITMYDNVHINSDDDASTSCRNFVLLSSGSNSIASDAE